MNQTSLKIQIEQINFIVGDLEGNCQKIIDAYQNANRGKTDLVVFSELSLTGYPPEDLLLKDYFIKEIEEKIKEICLITKDKKTAALIGTPASFTNRYGKKILYNAAILIEDGAISSIIHKSNLPNYELFDEKRHFEGSPTLSDIKFRGFHLAVLICEDIWDQKNAFLLACKEVDAFITLNASPFSQNKLQERIKVAQNFIKHTKSPLIYSNQIGGQDSIVFDGSSFVIDGGGEVKLLMQEFAEDSASIELRKHDKNIELVIPNNTQNKDIIIEKHPTARIYNATILGLRDYIIKNGFDKVLIGLSGGIDSALVATIAVDALGSQKVKLFALPSRYNSDESMSDAKKLSKNLNIKLEVISIEEIFSATNNSLAKHFANTESGIAEENMQSRIRGLILMSISNKFNYLLLSTGNKSENAVGYATIYGDMCGAYNPIKDIYKTEVFKLAKWRNSNIPQISTFKQKNLIPQNIITKPPSAELRENQKDSDSLPNYEILDQILFNLIEEQKSQKEIIALGFDKTLIEKITKLLYNSEYKRRQSVIGPKISKMSFDKDRRYPITNKFRQ